MTLAALDPWSLDFEQCDGDDDLRIAALRDFVDFVEEHPDLEVLRFIDNDFYCRFWPFFYDVLKEELGTAANPLPLADFIGLFSRFECVDGSRPLGRAESSEPATLRWREEVARAIHHDDHPNWRDPVIFIPRHRQVEWGSGEEVRVPPDAAALGVESVLRVIVFIDRPTENRLFVRDFDPWKSETARQASNDIADRDFPRPSASIRLPMSEWMTSLQAIGDHVDTTVSVLTFIPPESWNPTRIGKAQWRDSPFGEHGRKGEWKGPKDRRGRIWSWDDTHRTHWDVQHEGDRDWRYMNVRPDGLIARHY